MSKLLLDANILLDFIDPDRPESDQAVELFRRCINGIDTGCVSAGSLIDVYYVSKKYLGEQAARDYFRAFVDAFTVCSLDKAICKIAANSNEPDAEDAAVRAIAESISVDFIITRDAGAFKTSKIKSMSAAEYLDIFAG
ncbi:MAG: PIN domain-containing protein [Atopobium sp.]|uniref:type II toxin-antitoxin system VapC family toxin n=1 Tax=Atopobium sp. TaxID=1872650 RepID=UPI002A755D67|nr:PIN domain-containing protein [Atopobium sp.]MDY2788256.1 PIN domain-containing protein [Atopobium sp.]MDY4522795.1 PIN domain-containing protein [Atopobium sp.]